MTGANTKTVVKPQVEITKNMPTYTALCLALLVAACTHSTPPPPDDICTMDWVERVEALVPTDDGQGHGPDPGSSEWKYVLEFRLGIRDNTDIPDHATREWCEYIHKHISKTEPQPNI